MILKILLSAFFYSFYLLFPFLAFLIWELLKKNKRPIEIVILIIIVIIIIWARFIEPSYIKIKKHNFSKKNISTEEKLIKIAIFSDIHLGAFNNQLIVEKLVKKINQINPDLVLILGDFIYAINKENINSNISGLKNIKAPKIAVLGNHDYGKKGNNYYSYINSALESAGVLMVDNKIKTININNSLIEIIGIADLWVGAPDYNVLNLSGFEDQIDLSILLTHNPDTIYEISEKIKESNKRIDLMVSGHTHAGQIRIPKIYKHLIPSEYKFDKYFYNIKDIDLFITPGIGNVVLPMRLFNFPEISVIDIKY